MFWDNHSEASKFSRFDDRVKMRNLGLARFLVRHNPPINPSSVRWQKPRTLSVCEERSYFSGDSRWVVFNVVERGIAVMCYHCFAVAKFSPVIQR